jgi:multidrug transporter EmrE-like cation transporter
MHPWQHFVPLVTAAALNAGANVMLKVSAHSKPIGGDPNRIVQGFTHWTTLLSMGMFAANVVFYRRALEVWPVSIAYPLMITCGLVTITAVDQLVLRYDGPLNASQYIGLVCLACGAWLMVRPS